MSSTDYEVKPLPTIWRVPDTLWELIEPLLLEHDGPKRTGRKRINARQALEGIIYRMRTGCQWNHLPKEFGDDSSLHRTFQRWNRLGIFELIWAQLLGCCDELGGVDWQWQSVDGCLGKARGVPKKGQSSKPLAPIPPIVPSQEPRKA